LSHKAAEPNPPTPNDTPSFLRKLSEETHLLLQYLHDFFFYDLPVLLPRAIAFVATLQLSTEYGFQTVSCEGPSMEPTIIDGSYSCVLIERWSHRLFGLEKDDDHAPEKKEEECTTAGVNDSEYSWFALIHGIWEQHFASGLQHGDVIILHHPSKEATICKRIIGMPGDTIVRTDLVDEESSHRVVPPGHLWIEGDNTNNSLDSRSYGTVPASLVIGKVVCRLWPLRDYISLGMDANGMEHWKRVSARIGRGERPVPVTGSQTDICHGSYVLMNDKASNKR
jgi:signal peptidase I